MKVRLGQAPFDGDGRGVRIAVIDSGINVENPHVRSYAGGIAIADDGSLHEDVLDRVGHGTAVAAAIQEKAPAAELFVVRVFETTMTTRAANIARAIEWAADNDMHLANLSLGSTKPESAEVLGRALDTASAAAMSVVSVHFHRGVRWWPGSLPGAVGVIADPACPRDELRWEPGKAVGDVSDKDAAAGGVLAASPLPRPIPGVPPERNVSGISFAVANATGFLARAIERRGPLPGDLRGLMSA
jgi:hypothetical protein